MSKRVSKTKPPGETKVNEWDFMALLHKDIKDLEIRDSLRKLGNMQVMEWDFRTVLPAVSRLAHQEVDLVDLAKRTAAFKVMEWDFRRAFTAEPEPAARDAKEIQELIVRLTDFLRYVALNLIDEPGYAQIKVRQIAPGVLRFKLILVKRDLSMLIGKEGHTAAAIRNILQATARRHGLHALLQIHSHEEEAAGSGE